MHHKAARGYLQFIILAIVLGLSCWYIVSNRHDLARIAHIQLEAVILLLGLNLLFMFLSSLIFKILLKPLGISLDPVEYFGLTVTTNFANYMLPGRLGLATKVVYLRRKFSLPYAKFASYFVAQSVFLLGTGALGGLIVSAMASHSAQGPMLKLSIVFLALLAPLILLLALRPRLPQTKNRILQQILLGLDGWEAIRAEPLLVTQMVCLYVLSYVVLAFSVKARFAAIEQSISFQAAFLIAVLGTLGGYINLTPANLGIQEALFALLSQLLGYGFDVGILAAGLNRIVQVIVVFSLAPIFSYLLAMKLPKEGEMESP